MPRMGSGEEGHLYRDMFENAVWGIFQTTEDGRYLTANPALARIYGYDTAEEMLGALTDIGRQLYVDPARREDFIRMMKEDGVVRGFESEVHHRAGGTIWISENCRAVRNTAGTLLYYEGMVEDITQRKRGEAELRAAKQAAEAASRAKSAFLANMSHELRTPLNSVLGFSEILGSQLYGPLGDARYLEYARDIHASGVHLLSLINDILDQAKIEGGHFVLHESEVDVRSLVLTCERLLGPSAREHGILLEVVPPKESLYLRADATRLKQILLNLLSNALKFTPDGNRVMVSAGLGEDRGFVLVVADTGIGMTKSETARALEPFQQIDNTFTRRHQGTGLGLSLTNALVRLHGGTFDLDSVPGAGTVATVRFPAARVLRGLQA